MLNASGFESRGASLISAKTVIFFTRGVWQNNKGLGPPLILPWCMFYNCPTSRQIIALSPPARPHLLYNLFTCNWPLISNFYFILFFRKTFARLLAILMLGANCEFAQFINCAAHYVNPRIAQQFITVNRTMINCRERTYSDMGAPSFSGRGGGGGGGGGMAPPAPPPRDALEWLWLKLYNSCKPVYCFHAHIWSDCRPMTLKKRFQIGSISIKRACLKHL